MNEAGPESELEKYKTWETRIFLLLCGTQGSLFLVLWIERDDFFQFFCQHLLHNCSCHPALSSKSTVKRKRKRNDNNKQNPKPWNSSYRLLINFDFSLYFCIIVYFSESSSNYLFDAVPSFSCGQRDGLVSTYPILTSMRISVTNICLFNQQGAIQLACWHIYINENISNHLIIEY